MEIEFFFEIGDFCNDINLVFKYKFCGDLGLGNDICGFYSFFNIFYNNFMSYVDDDCMDFFMFN